MISQGAVSGSSMLSENYEKLLNFCNSLNKKKPIAILLQNNPDPDCIGAAAGFSLLVREKFGLKCNSFYKGDVSHPQNKSMLNTLGIEISKVADIDLSKHCAIVVLDTDLQSTGFAKEGLVSPNIRIDHHDMRPSEATALEDIRPVGSTCSLIWDYLRQAEIDMSSHADVVTALVLGIKTDTLEFSAENTSDLDYEAFRSLIPHVDRSKMARLTKYILPQSLFEHESRAYSNHIIKNSVLVTSIGHISPLRRDDIPMVADRFSRMDAISTVIVLGFIEDYMVASVRSQDSRVNVYDLCCALFGKDFCGAKAGSGGAKVPLGMMSRMIGGDELRNAVEKSMLEHIASKLFSYLGEE